MIMVLRSIPEHSALLLERTVVWLPLYVPSNEPAAAATPTETTPIATAIGTTKHGWVLLLNTALCPPLVLYRYTGKVIIIGHEREAAVRPLLVDSPFRCPATRDIPMLLSPGM